MYVRTYTKPFITNDAIPRELFIIDDSIRNLFKMNHGIRNLSKMNDGGIHNLVVIDDVTSANSQ